MPTVDAFIKGKISIDTGASAKSINDLNKEIAQTKTALKDAKIGSDEHKTSLALLTQQQSQLKAATDQSNQSQSKSAQAFGTLKEKVGQLVPGLKGAESAGNSFSNTLKAIALTPVVAVIIIIVGLLKLVYEAFKNTFEGGEKVEQVFAGIKAAGQALVDSLQQIGSAIIKVFKFDFSGAVAEIKGVAKAAGEAYNVVARLTAEKQKLEREESANDLDKAKRDRDLAKLKAEAFDEDIPIAQRIGKLKILREAAEKDAAADLDLNKRIADNKVKFLSQGLDAAKKNESEINKVRAEQIRGETQSANELRNIGKTLSRAEKQVDAERKAVEKEAADRRKQNTAAAKEAARERDKILKERLKIEKEYATLTRKNQIRESEDLEEHLKQIEKAEADAAAREKARLAKNAKDELTVVKKLAELDTLNDPKSIKFKLAKIKADLALELNALQEGDMQRFILIKKASDAEVQVNKDAAEAKKQIADLEAENKMRNVTAVGNILSSLGSLVGKQTAAGKGLAVASSLIDTYAAIVGTLRAAAKTPMGGIPGYAIAQAVATGIAGFAAVKNIIKVQVPGGGGSSSPSIGSLPAPLAPVQTSTALNQESINGIGNAAQGGTSRAFVLDSDIRSGDERQKRLVRAARLG